MKHIAKEVGAEEIGAKEVGAEEIGVKEVESKEVGASSALQLSRPDCPNIDSGRKPCWIKNYSK